MDGSGIPPRVSPARRTADRPDRPTGSRTERGRRGSCWADECGFQLCAGGGQLTDQQRWIEERWRRARALGAFVDLDRRVDTSRGEIAVVATLADFTQTVVVYRGSESRIWPRAVSPRELVGAANGTIIEDLQVISFPAVGPDVTAIVVRFGHFGDNDTTDVELPVDPARTRPYERRSVRAAEPLDVDGVAVQAVSAAVGLLGATIEMEVSSEDPTVAGASLAPVMGPTPPLDVTGTGPLWREWFPPRVASTAALTSAFTASTPTSTPGVRRVTARGSATGQITATRTGRVVPESKPPSAGWQVRALPGGEELVTYGFAGGGGSIGPTLKQHWALRFEPPPDGATALELLVDDLFVFRTGRSEVVAVPPPKPDQTVDLAGHSLTCGAERVELLRWEPRREGLASLVIAPSSTELWPDVRVVAGASSASLHLERMPDGRFVGGLPAAYDALFGDNEVSLALRAVGSRLRLPPITLTLTAPGPP